MPARLRFSSEDLQLFAKGRGLRIRAGLGRHRFIGIWFVMVRDRVFVRSWSVKTDGWYRTFLKQPRGTIQLGSRRLAVRAARVASASLRDAVDVAYLEKYNSRGALKYARDLGTPKSRATTLELVPCDSRT